MGWLGMAQRLCLQGPGSTTSLDVRGIVLRSRAGGGAVQVTKQENDEVCFDLIKETLRATNLGVRSFFASRRLMSSVNVHTRRHCSHRSTLSGHTPLSGPHDAVRALGPHPGRLGFQKNGSLRWRGSWITPRCVWYGLG